MGGKQRDTLWSYNVIMAIARRIVFVCKDHSAQAHNRPAFNPSDFSNELGKQSFQNEFLNQCVGGRGEERRGR